MSLRSTRSGRIAWAAGPFAEAGHADAEHAEDDCGLRRVVAGGDPGESEAEAHLDGGGGDHDDLAVHHVGDCSGEGGQHEDRPELGERDEPHVGGVVRQLIGEGEEGDVLHPSADVRCERAHEDPAKRRAGERGAGGSGAVEGRGHRLTVRVDRIAGRIGFARPGGLRGCEGPVLQSPTVSGD